MVTLRTSATVERLDFWRHFDSRATAEEIFCLIFLLWLHADPPTPTRMGAAPGPQRLSYATL